MVVDPGAQQLGGRVERKTVQHGACSECGGEQVQRPDPGAESVQLAVIAHEPGCSALDETRRVIPW